MTRRVFAMLSIILLSPWLAAAEPAGEYHVETLAGNGMPGDIPEGGGKADQIAVDLPFGVENGPDGALYITTVGSHRVLRLDRESGKITSVAGIGRKGYSGDGGPATEAALNEPYEVRFDSRGNMLILEMVNHVIRRVDAKSGIISTIAGDGTAGDQGDGGLATLARFRHPHAICLDSNDNIYVSDLENHRVRRINAISGRIETIAGNGERGLPQEGGPAREQPLTSPQGIVVRGGDLFVASVSGQSLWRLDLETNAIHHVAGHGKRGHTGDGGDPLMATFDGPRGMTISPEGVLYLAEGENNLIRAVDPAKKSIRTVAGVGPNDSEFNGDGANARKAAISQPHGVCIDADGALIFSDTKNHRVRRLVPRRPK